MHRQAVANCTDAKLYFWTIFQFFFIQMGPGPTHPLPNYFWNFFNFAKPLNEVNVSFLGKHTNITEDENNHGEYKDIDEENKNSDEYEYKEDMDEYE